MLKGYICVDGPNITKVEVNVNFGSGWNRGHSVLIQLADAGKTIILDQVEMREARLLRAS